MSEPSKPDNPLWQITTTVWKIADYEILTASLLGIPDAVHNYMRDNPGWEPYGIPFIDPDEKQDQFRWQQVMVKRERFEIPA